MPQKGQITKGKWGFWHYSSIEYGVCEYKETTYGVVPMMEGPYNTFTEAKAALQKSIDNQLFDYRQAAKLVRRLKKSMCTNKPDCYEGTDNR